MSETKRGWELRTHFDDLDVLNLTSIVVFHADLDGGVHFWGFGLVWELRAHKMTIKPAKIAVLGLNLKIPEYGVSS